MIIVGQRRLGGACQQPLAAMIVSSGEDSEGAHG